MNFKFKAAIAAVATFAALSIAVPASGNAATPSVRPKVTISAAADPRIETYAYAGTTDVDQELDAYYDTTASGAPWVVCIHGGSLSAGDRKSGMQPCIDTFLEAGFAVFNIDYRLSTDYPGNPGAAWPAPRNDVVSAFNFIRANAAQFHINANRGAVYGFSSGGHLAAAAGLYGNGSSRVKAIVSVSGVLQPHRVWDVAMSDPDVGKQGDFPTYNNKVLANWLSVSARCPNLPTWTECSRQWTDMKPETHISADDPDMLMYQGDADPSVPSQTVISFDYWLKREGVGSQYVMVPDVGHDANALVFNNATRKAQMVNFIKARTP